MGLILMRRIIDQKFENSKIRNFELNTDTQQISPFYKNYIIIEQI